MTEPIASQINDLDQRPTPRRWGKPIAVVVALGAIIGASPWIPTTYVTLEPGPAPDTKTLTKIEARTFDSQGSFHITTALVSPRGVSLQAAMRAMLLPDADLIPRDLVYPPDKTRKQADQLHAEQMSESQHSAASAALAELGIRLQPDGLLVRSVVKDGPANKEVDPGDVLIRADGKVLSKKEDLTGLITKKRPGDAVALSIRRDGTVRDVTVGTKSSGGESPRTVIGVTVSNNDKFPFEVSIEAGDIGGPSAGLMFALSIYDLLEPSDLTGGKTIAGTGTITPDGKVGRVGAVAQKIRGAEKVNARVFIVPRDELDEAKAVKTKMRIIPAATLAEAVAALKVLR